MNTIYLIRHAQSHYDAAIPDERRPLTAKGREQAAALAAVLLRLDIQEIHSSPYRRCLDTVRPFAQTSALQLKEVADLRERSFTQGLIEDWADIWRRVWTDFDFAFPDGESSRQAQIATWDADFTIAELASFATRVETNQSRSAAVQSAATSDVPTPILRAARPQGDGI